MKQTAELTGSARFIELEERYGAHNYHPLDVVIARAEGAWVWDVEGTRYMDFLAAYSAVNQGHCHPRLVKVMQEQAHMVTLTSRAIRNDQLGPFCEELAKLTGFQRVLPMNTGAEAVETAIKTARKWGYTKKGVADGKAKIICCEGNFHGRTTTIVSFSTDEQARSGFGPYTPGFEIIPYGDAQALEGAISANTVAFLFEPIQGEGGVVVPPEGFLQKVREICTKNEILMIADEIQSGLGRTGKTFACEHDGVVPDIYILGKALGGGIMPISAVVSSREILSVFTPGDHGSTFGGNPLACAVARKVLAMLKTGVHQKNAAELGDYLFGRLRSGAFANVELVRGRGLWVGIVIKKSFGSARPICETLMADGLLCKETHETTIRLAPPIVITQDEIDWALERLEKALS